MFQIRNLTKRYGRRTVLDIGDLHLDQKKIYGLLGPNGSGKTTLLEILALLRTPDTGEVFFDGGRIDYASGSLHHLRRQIVLVQQNPVLFSTSVFKNLEFGLRIRGLESKERTRRIDEALHLVEMQEFRDAPAHTLSGGETQRIAIAMALACSPRVLFFDEPFASVDVENQVAIERTLTWIHAEKKIFVAFTSHNVEQALRLSRQTLSLSDGKPVSGWIHNLFYGRVIEGADGRRRCRIQEKLELFVDSKKTGNVRLSIDPAQVGMLSSFLPEMENTVAATVVQIAEEGNHVRITGDAGVLISLLVTRQKYKAASPALGDKIVIRIPESAVRIS